MREEWGNGVALVGVRIIKKKRAEWSVGFALGTCRHDFILGAWRDGFGPGDFVLGACRDDFVLGTCRDDFVPSTCWHGFILGTCRVNFKEYPHLWLCARSSEEYLYLKSTYAPVYVRSSEECLDLKSAHTTDQASHHPQGARSSLGVVV